MEFNHSHPHLEEDLVRDKTTSNSGDFSSFPNMETQIDRGNATVDITLTETEGAIMNGTASVEVILDWYYSEDPLAEAFQEKNISYLSNSSTEYTEQLAAWYWAHAKLRPLMLAKSAELMVSHTLSNMPEVEELVSRGEIDMNDAFSVQGLTEYGEHFTNEDIEQLLVSADMHSLSAVAYTQLANQYMELPKDIQDSEDLMEIESAHNNMDKQTLMGVGLFHVVEDMGLSENPARDQESRIIALQSSMKLNSHTLARVKAIDHSGLVRLEDRYISETKQAVFEGWLNAVEKTFLSEDDSSPTIKGSQKGFLHEALWLIDANFRLETSSSERMRNSFVAPSSIRADRPRINRPTYKRSYDVIATVGFKRSIVAQLKSSRRASDRSADYHPTRIEEITEDNFQDVNKRRLRSKLKAYREWIRDDFSEKTAERVRSKILPSTNVFIESMAKVSEMSDYEYAMGKLPTQKLTRQQRRKLQRSLS